MLIRCKYFTGIISLFLLHGLFSCMDKTGSNYLELIERGEFSNAKEVIENILTNNDTLTKKEKSKLSFEIERMERIKKDFTKTEKDVLDYIKKYIPDLTPEMMAKWEEEKSLEHMIVDGEKLYFNYAGRNLFRINEECREIWNKYHKQEDKETSTKYKFDLDGHIKDIMDQYAQSGKKYVDPVRMKIKYSISVKADVVPENEIICCWIPYPREIPNRQVDISLIRSEPPVHKLADNKMLQRTIYMEKPAGKGKPTDFTVEYEYTTYGVYVDIDADKVTAAKPDSELQPYLREEPPHIVFTDDLKELSQIIVDRETNPYHIARILYEWVDVNIPWASAREYSTIRSLSSYPYENMHGDCGIQTMLFITLCRMNGIPARWQSGWRFKPPTDSMHDWGMIYFEPYGWMPMDVTYGLRETDDKKLKWFYLNGMDSYRLIFNDEYSQPFDPPKTHHRSETIDSQRGEVEWRGGNLYFDQWNWDMKWEVLED